MNNWTVLSEHIQAGSFRHLARGITCIENDIAGTEELLQSLPVHEKTKIIGITGPPGAGKSTLTDALIGHLVSQGNKIAVLCIDPSSPFHHGALLGDRIRMSDWYNHPGVFIRSLATRGALGGLHPKIIEITEFMKAAGFDYILVETVGVGQSEIEIAGLADVTVVVVVPEAGDEVQTMKAGLMEIADIFVVNKADRPGADQFVKNLRAVFGSPAAMHPAQAIVLKTVAVKKEGISGLEQAILQCVQQQQDTSRKAWLLAEKAYQLIVQKRMKGIYKNDLQQSIAQQLTARQFNLFRFVQQFTTE